MLIMDICEFIAGGWFFGLLQRHRLNKLLKDQQTQLQLKETDLSRREAVLTHKQATLDLLDRLKETENRLRSLQGRLNGEHDDLNRLTVEDAIRRENRAKAALKAVMEKDGCSQESIEQVLNSVDGGEDGDF